MFFFIFKGLLSKQIKQIFLGGESISLGATGWIPGYALVKYDLTKGIL